MALWKEFQRKQQLPVETDEIESGLWPSEAPSREEERSHTTESFIAAGMIIEGKIRGVGHLRFGGRFEGNMQVDGDLTIEPGAHITGDLRADIIRIGGEIHGNIYASSRVELLRSGTLIGDLRAGSLTSAVGSRMRGKVEFGWDEQEPLQLGASKEGEAG